MEREIRSRFLILNYRPISLLPIYGKNFQKIIFYEIYHHLSHNDLSSSYQSGFLPGDLTINQLPSKTREIYEAFENYHEARAVFLDISKALIRCGIRAYYSNLILMAWMVPCTFLFKIFLLGGFSLSL